MVITRLVKEKSVFLCCDIQSIFAKTIHKFDHISHTASCLVEAAKIFNIPVVVSEQYPEKLGHTVPTIDTGNSTVYPKTKFSMLTSTFPQNLLRERSSFVLFGIETHVCVQQTALDLLATGKHVILVTDGVSSSRPLDRSTAIHRLSSAGVDLMTSESILFELMQTKDCSEFKEISTIAKRISAYSQTHSESTLSNL
jgi:nicotinamidase-related amidase